MRFKPLVTSVRRLPRQAKARIDTLEQGLFQLYDHFVRMQDALAQVNLDNDQLKLQIQHERQTRMNENLTTREALDTVSQKLDDAAKRNQQQSDVFGTFVKNVMHKLDELAAKASDPAVPALTDADFAELKQMADTADKIGLTGLADFGVTPDGDHLSAAPSVPVAPPSDPAPAVPVSPTEAPVPPPSEPPAPMPAPPATEAATTPAVAAPVEVPVADPALPAPQEVPMPPKLSA